MTINLPLHHATAVTYFFSVLFHEQLGVSSDITAILKKSYPELTFEPLIFFPKNNPLLTYYAKQMGDDVTKLKRFFCYATNPLPRDLLATFKQRGIELEREYFTPFRTLNIDPGYVAQEQMLLSSHKPFTHRIYLQNGIYAELEYLYRDHKWHELPWTYPDYNDEEKKRYFMAIRRLTL